MIGESEISSGDLQKFNSLDRVGSAFGNNEALPGLVAIALRNFVRHPDPGATSHDHKRALGLLVPATIRVSHRKRSFD
jgi:hypothetical protein